MTVLSIKEVYGERINVIFYGKGFIRAKEKVHFHWSSASGQGQVSPKSLPPHRLKGPGTNGADA